MQLALVKHLVGNPAGPYLLRKYIGGFRSSKKFVVLKHSSVSTKLGCSLLVLL